MLKFFCFFLFFVFLFSPTFLSAQSLENQSSPLSLYKSQQRWKKYAEELKKYWNELSPEEQANSEQEVAEAFFKARDYSDAALHYQHLSEKSENQTNPEIWDKLTSSYTRSSQFDAALQSLEKLSELEPKKEETWRYRKLFILYDAGKCKQALPLMETYLGDYPKGTKSDETLWLKFWCLKNEKKVNEALLVLEEIVQKYPQSKTRVSFWKNKIYLAMGKKREAIESKNDLNQRENSFYNQWIERSSKLNAHACLMAKTPYSSSQVSKDFEPHGAKKNKKKKMETAITPLSETEILQLIQSQNLEKREGEDINDWILRNAKIRNLSPALVYAIMYRESHFNAQVVSPVGAIGLMQLIPETGYETADLLALSDFNFQDLMDPYTNAKFGITYLSYLLEKFSGNLVYTIAAYNAGPEAVGRWLELRKHNSCEEWMDQIPYKETYQYVQKVLQSYWDYERELPKVALKN